MPVIFLSCLLLFIAGESASHGTGWSFLWLLIPAAYLLCTPWQRSSCQSMTSYWLHIRNLKTIRKWCLQRKSAACLLIGRILRRQCKDISMPIAFSVSLVQKSERCKDRSLIIQYTWIWPVISRRYCLIKREAVSVMSRVLSRSKYAILLQRKTKKSYIKRWENCTSRLRSTTIRSARSSCCC